MVHRVVESVPPARRLAARNVVVVGIQVPVAPVELGGDDEALTSRPRPLMPCSSVETRRYETTAAGGVGGFIASPFHN